MAKIDTGLHSGHRQRMREKFLDYGRDVFHSHELLEMLLFHAVQYKNTNPIAKNLLSRFSTLDGVFSASREELLSVEGVGPKIADMILAVGKIDVLSDAEEPVDNAKRIFDDYCSTGQFFVDYFDSRFTYETVILLLNSKMEYLDCRTLYELDYDTAAIKAEPFIDAAIRARAAVAIIAHNHPYGPPFPSIGDKATNNMIAESLSKSGVLLAEHYVVSGKKFVGFMNNLTMAFSQYSDVERFFESKRRDG
jgi:DNA repair protein RadC